MTVEGFRSGQLFSSSLPDAIRAALQAEDHLVEALTVSFEAYPEKASLAAIVTARLDSPHFKSDKDFRQETLRMAVEGFKTPEFFGHFSSLSPRIITALQAEDLLVEALTNALNRPHPNQISLFDVVKARLDSTRFENDKTFRQETLAMAIDGLRSGTVFMWLLPNAALKDADLLVEALEAARKARPYMVPLLTVLKARAESPRFRTNEAFRQETLRMAEEGLRSGDFLLPELDRETDYLIPNSWMESISPTGNKTASPWTRDRSPSTKQQSPVSPPESYLNPDPNLINAVIAFVLGEITSLPSKIKTELNKTGVLVEVLEACGLDPSQLVISKQWDGKPLTRDHMDRLLILIKELRS